jgi:tRNA A-37 threonylcarbamoyl transferase component Bud32
MCNDSLSILSNRRKNESSLSVRRKLKKLFKELSTRCGSLMLDRELFLRLTLLPGLLGEQVFNSLDEDEDNKLDVKEFVLGLCTIYEGSLESVCDFLFKVFNFTRNGQISRIDVKSIYEYLPNICHKCKKSFSPTWDLPEVLQQFFESEKFLVFESFLEKTIARPEVCELVLQNILGFLPEVFDDIFTEELEIKKNQKVQFEGFLKFKKRSYFAILKKNSLFLSRKKGSRTKSIILTSDLFLDTQENLQFSLKNGKYSYDFQASHSEDKQNWIDHLLTTNKSRDIHKDYKILEKVIGKGAYGKVKLAENLTTSEIVAVKIISKEPLDNRSATRLRREISILQICHHENIVALKDIYETFDNFFIVTEYVQGGSLFSWIKTRGFRVDEETAKLIIFSIAKAVQYLHSLGIVHRDIKLENILLDTSSDVKPKIIDFGLSCMLGPGQFSQEAVGTLKYASPELISRIPYRETPDVWGIGVILYILLTGKIPFYGENDQEIANRILKKKIDLDNERWAEISCDAKDVVARLLTRKANERMKIQELLEHSWFDGKKL